MIVKYDCLKVKRTSAWNKASEELKRYQELYEKYKDKPEFINSQYGDPFDGEKVSQLTTSFGQDSESEVRERKRKRGREGGREGVNVVMTDENRSDVCDVDVVLCCRARTSRTASPGSPGPACQCWTPAWCPPPRRSPC